MADLPSFNQAPYTERNNFSRGFAGGTEFDLEFIVPSTDYGVLILEGIDFTAIGPPTPVQFSAQIAGTTFWYDGQTIGAGLGVYASWRGYIVLPEAARFDLFGTSSIAVGWAVIAWGRYVGGVLKGTA